MGLKKTEEKHDTFARAPKREQQLLVCIKYRTNYFYSREGMRIRGLPAKVKRAEKG